MPPASKEATSFTGTLEIARRDLLDLGLRNTLLNYRPLRSKGIEVIDEKPIEVFQLLVKEEKSLTFLSGDAVGPHSNGSATDIQLAQPEDEGNGATRHRDSRLQTAYPPTQLQSRLLATYHAARTSMEEQGVNTLYLALGMLSWKEEDTSEKFCRAPLILIPVELGRSDARDRFHLKYTGDELGENVSLAEKLKQGFGIRKFPELPDPDDLDVGTYFKNVQRAVSGQSGWSVDTDSIALGFFSFAKFLMYRDLDPATWPAADAILGHGVLQALLAEQGFQPSSSTYREDCMLDDQIQDRNIVHVVDSDSSQTIAILDCLDGHTMVIQGPPGTGKSQTIVNLIAGAVALGKRVLFVSEKMAALDVVKRRLDHVRLGGACLELHSNRTNKKTIIEELRRTALGERQAIPQARGELSLLADARNRLNAYCQAVNEPIGASRENPCTAYGRLLNAQTSLNGLDLPALPLEGAVDWTGEDVARRAQLVAQLQERVIRSGIPIRHPFWGSQLKILLPTDRDEIRKLTVSAAGTHWLRTLVRTAEARWRRGVFRRTSPNGPGSRDAVSIGPAYPGSSRSWRSRPEFSGVAIRGATNPADLGGGRAGSRPPSSVRGRLAGGSLGHGHVGTAAECSRTRWSLVAIAFQSLAARKEVFGCIVYLGTAARPDVTTRPTRRLGGIRSMRQDHRGSQRFHGAFVHGIVEGRRFRLGSARDTSRVGDRRAEGHPSGGTGSVVRRADPDCRRPRGGFRPVQRTRSRAPGLPAGRPEVG